MAKHDLEVIGRAVHEAIRAYCVAVGDPALPPWDEHSEEMKDSTFQGIHLHLSNPHASPSASHESWMEHRLANGWKYGEVKDVEAKTDPNLVPYDDLSEVQKQKDRIFKAIVNSFTLRSYLGPCGVATRARLGIGFNPSGDADIARIKDSLFDAMDHILSLHHTISEDHIVKREDEKWYLKMALDAWRKAADDLESAQMFAVKGVVHWRKALATTTGIE